MSLHDDGQTLVAAGECAVGEDSRFGVDGEMRTSREELFQDDAPLEPRGGGSEQKCAPIENAKWRTMCRPTSTSSALGPNSRGSRFAAA